MATPFASNFNRAVLSILLAACALNLTASANEVATDEQEQAYTRTITERADKIVAPLEIDDEQKRTRVRDTIVAQYRNLRKIHDARDAQLQSAEGRPTDPAVADAWKGVVRNRSDMELFRLHRQFVARLSAELAPDQVTQIKDGMTYGVVPITYNRYLELLPSLTDEQKSVILAHLLEAREYAMDAGSAEEKHQWFGKYKGRINNYLSAAGYDLKQAEKDWTARQKQEDEQEAIEKTEED